jgi:hypothetical protein
MDLFLIRDNSVCRGRSLLFKKSCKLAPFLSMIVVRVHRCSRALSSNCRHRSATLNSARRTLIEESMGCEERGAVLDKLRGSGEG